MALGWEVRLQDPKVERRRRWLAYMLAVPLSFAAGWSLNAYVKEPTPNGPSQEQVLIERQQTQIEFLQQRLAVVNSSERVGQQALEQNRQTIKSLQEQLFELQQALASYQGVLNPSGMREGVQIRDVELQATDDSDRYRYKILLRRVGDGQTPFEGQVHIAVNGRASGKRATLELPSLSTGDVPALMPISFKYFQAIPEDGGYAHLLIPKGFAPEALIITVSTQGAEPVRRTVPWIKQE